MKKEKASSKQTRFVAARRNSDGTLSQFKDNSGKTYDYEQALEAVESGLVENAIPFTGRDGARHIRGMNDGNEKTNLKNLKDF